MASARQHFVRCAPNSRQASALVASSGIAGQWWSGPAPAPALDRLAGAGLRHSRAGPLSAACWGAAATADWRHLDDLSLGVHGEIFNRGELAQALDLGASATLLQVLHVGWQRWGEALFSRIDGIFAVAVLQPGRLTLYRDPSGLSSLYCYHDAGWQVSFATDLDALMLLPGTRRRIARQSLHEYLRFLEIAAPNTFFEHVMAPEPGYVHVWPPALPGDGPRPRIEDAVASMPFEAATDALDGHLERSVSSRLEGASAPAAFLSGGVDSALLCALASRSYRQTTAITVGFDLEAYDESPVAGRIAAHLGLEHRVLRFSHAEYLDAFDRFSADAEQPMADPASLATLLAFEECRRVHDAVLDGTGADESVGMMPPRHIRMAVSSATAMPDAVRSRLARLTRQIDALGGFTPILDFEHPAETMIPWNGFSRSEIARLCGEEVSFAHTHFYATFERERRKGHFALYSALLNAIPCERLTQAMRISGARVRFPFCELRTDRFLRSLPIEHRYRRHEPKRVLRKLLGRHVPPEIWDGPKHGFTFPLDAFLSRDDFALVRRHLDGERWSASGLLAPQEVRRYASRYIEGDQRLTFRVWALVVLSAWLERRDLLPP